MLGQKEVVFSGGLSSKKVDELCDITFALSKDEGNKDAIITLIKTEPSTQSEL